MKTMLYKLLLPIFLSITSAGGALMFNHFDERLNANQKLIENLTRDNKLLEESNSKLNFLLQSNNQNMLDVKSSLTQTAPIIIDKTTSNVSTNMILFCGVLIIFGLFVYFNSVTNASVEQAANNALAKTGGDLATTQIDATVDALQETTRHISQEISSLHRKIETECRNINASLYETKADILNEMGKISTHTPINNSNTKTSLINSFIENKANSEVLNYLTNEPNSALSTLTDAASIDLEQESLYSFAVNSAHSVSNMETTISESIADVTVSSPAVNQAAMDISAYLATGGILFPDF